MSDSRSKGSSPPWWVRPVLAAVLVARGGPRYLQRLPDEHFRLIAHGCVRFIVVCGAAASILTIAASRIGGGPIGVLLASIASMVVLIRVGAPVSRERRRRQSARRG